MLTVHLASSGELGGAERVILDILTGLRGRDATTLHLVVPREGALAREARAIGIGVTVVPWSAALSRLGDSMVEHRAFGRLAFRLVKALTSILGDAFRLGRTLHALNPDIVHAHGLKMHVLGAWTRPWRTPIVLHLHDYIGSRRFMSRILAITPPGTTRAIAISNSVRDDARRVLSSRTPIDVVYNGIDTTVWSPRGPALDADAAAGLPAAAPRTVRIGLVATMARWKGHETFLRAVAMLPVHLPVRAYIIGGSIYDTDASQYTIPELRSLAATLELEDRIGFTGFMPDPVQAMRALDIVVHASTRPEPFGRVIVEGMATARAVVARPNGGAAELFTPEVEAAACMSDDPAELAGILARLVASEAERRRLGARGRDRVRLDFTRDRMVASIASVYENLQRPAAPAAIPR